MKGEKLFFDGREGRWHGCQTGRRLRRCNSTTTWTEDELLTLSAMTTRGRQRVKDSKDLPGKNLTKRGMKWNCGHPGESLSKRGPGDKSRGVMLSFPQEAGQPVMIILTRDGINSGTQIKSSEGKTGLNWPITLLDLTC